MADAANTSPALPGTRSQDLPSAATPVLQPLEVGKKPATEQLDQEARSEAVGELLAAAYARASMLEITPDESRKLLQVFRDDQVRGGAAGEEKLLYVSHIHLSDRLNGVLGIGQWCLVKRSQRGESCRTKAGEPMMRVYFEGVMLIRGAYVAEAIGCGAYHPNNPKENFSGAIEIAMSDCLSRCCKRLGIGSQCWDKGFCEVWLAKYAKTKPVPQDRTEAVRATLPARPPPATTATAAPTTTAISMDRITAALKAGKIEPPIFLDYLRAQEFIGPTDPLEEMPDAEAAKLVSDPLAYAAMIHAWDNPATGTESRP